MAEYTKRREHPRLNVDISVKLRLNDGNAMVSTQIRNISLGGVFIEMENPIGFGDEVGLEFSLPGAPRTIRCKGFVVWSTKTQPDRGNGRQGIGLRLMDIGISDMRVLAGFIDQALKG